MREDLKRLLLQQSVDRLLRTSEGQSQGSVSQSNLSLWTSLAIIRTPRALLRGVISVANIPHFKHIKYIIPMDSSLVLECSQGPKDINLHTITTSIIRTPRYYGQSSRSQRYQTSNKHHLHNTDQWRTILLVLKIPNSIQYLRLLYRHVSITVSCLGLKRAKLLTIPASLIHTLWMWKLGSGPLVPYWGGL